MGCDWIAQFLRVEGLAMIAPDEHHATQRK